MPTARYSRRFKRLFFSGFTVLATVFVGLSVMVAHDSLKGGEATAEIIGVKNARSVLYTVTFVTADGRPCTGILSSHESNELAVGDPVVIRYDGACRNVWRPEDYGWVMFPVVSLLFLGIGVLGAYFAWFRTLPDGRIRWRLPIRNADLC
jgi:hypothetical protein